METVPAGQLVQIDSPELENFPAEQERSQLDAFVKLEYNPAAHAMQTEDEVELEKKPSLQSAHVELDEFR
jgi:hypothetical protein